MNNQHLFLVPIISGLLLIFWLPVSSQDDLTVSIERGQKVYSGYCAACHMAEGQGMPGVFPPLAASDYLENPEAVMEALKYGLEGEIVVNGVTYNNVMTPLGLTNQQIADVMNYVYANWGNNGNTFTAAQVSKAGE